MELLDDELVIYDEELWRDVSPGHLVRRTLVRAGVELKDRRKGEFENEKL